MTDFSIKVCDTAIHVHKCIISAVSDYFNAMFEAGMQEVSQGYVHLDSMDGKLVFTLVQYMYGQEIDISSTAIKEYLDAAELFRLNELKRELGDYMKSEIDPGNCLEWYYLADRYELINLRKKAKKILVAFFNIAADGLDLDGLSLTELLKLITDPDITSGGSSALLKTCINWILVDESYRKNFLGELIRHISLERCSVGYLRKKLDMLHQLDVDCDVLAKFERSIVSLDIGTRFQGESIAVLGGWSPGHVPNKTIFKINFRMETIDEIGTIPNVMVKYGHVHCVSRSSVFCAGGGKDPANPHTCLDCALFDTDLGEVKTLPSLLTPARGAQAVCIDRRLYMMGGEVTEDHLRCLDLDGEFWLDTCFKMKLKVKYPLACSVGHRLYVLPHAGRAQDITLQCYDTVQDEWSIKAPPPTDTVTSTYGSSAVAVETNIFILGGCRRLCVCYNTIKDEWTTLCPPREDHRRGGAVYIGNGKVILCGGKWAGQYSSTIEVYNIATNKWKTSQMRLPLPLWDPICSAF